MEDSEDDEVDVKITNSSGISEDISQYLRSLAFNQTFSDVTVLCDGRTYFCHKVMIYFYGNFLLIKRSILISNTSLGMVSPKIIEVDI